MWQRKRRKWLIKSQAMSPYGKMSSLGWSNGMNPFIFKTQWRDDCSQKVCAQENRPGWSGWSWRRSGQLQMYQKPKYWTHVPSAAGKRCMWQHFHPQMCHTLVRETHHCNKKITKKEKEEAEGRWMKRRKEQSKGKQRGKEVEEKTKRQEKQKREVKEYYKGIFWKAGGVRSEGSSKEQN